MAIACDTHVHCYQYEQLDQLLTHAAGNFAHWVPDAEHRVLFFTDGKVDKTWSRLQASVAANDTVGEWHLSAAEATGLILATGNGRSLYLAPARQLVSAERLEFLLLGCDQNIGDGMPAETIIGQYADRYVVIAPWGVGKWLGRRGTILTELMGQRPEPWFLGDNGGRPQLWVGVRQCRLARAQKMAVFNGSDPLPIAGELQRVASYGVRLEQRLSHFSLDALLGSMKNDADSWRNYGRAMGLLGFIRGRLAMLRR